MTNVIVALPKIENARKIGNLLTTHGISVAGACASGAAAIQMADNLQTGILVCAYKLPDMMYEELMECLPPGFEMLLLASQGVLLTLDKGNIVCLPMPLKVHELLDTISMMITAMERKRRARRSKPRQRTQEERRVIEEAKRLLMERNCMTEAEAHRYIQKCSMDSGNDFAETARMVLTLMQQ